jgi:hypothetical protein
VAPAAPIRNALRRALAFSEKVFDLGDWWERVRDRRPQGTIPTPVFVRAIFLLFMCRLRGLSPLTEHGGPSRHYLRHPMPCANEIAYAAARLDLDSVRDVVGHVHARLKRNKVLRRLRAWRLAAIDGHEINCSYDHSCPQCLTRELKVNGKKRIQYYHRTVALQLIGDDFRMMLDAELVRPGEDEVECALRLLERVLQRWPRCFDLLLGDGLYAQGKVFKLLRRHGKHGLMVLKDDRRNLLQDARGLFPGEPSKTYPRGRTRCRVWDIEGFKTWPQAGIPVRVVRSIEITKCRKHAPQGAKTKWQTVVEESEWIWVTDLTVRELPTADAVNFGHRRWDIENYGFNELSNAWHADHYFHHDPVAILAFWLILFIAHAVFHCFYQRNLKPQARAGRPMRAWSDQMFADLLQGELEFLPLPP